MSTSYLSILTENLAFLSASLYQQSRTWLMSLSMHACIGEGNGNPLQYSCLENPRDRRAWWAAIYGVAQSRTRLKWLSSSSSGYGVLSQSTLNCTSFLVNNVGHLLMCLFSIIIFCFMKCLCNSSTFLLGNYLFVRVFFFKIFWIQVLY